MLLTSSQKKVKKPALAAKYSILVAVKPWGDETGTANLEECVRNIRADVLAWGSSQPVPVGGGTEKLHTQHVVEDDKVGTGMLEEQTTAFDDCVPSVDVQQGLKLTVDW